MGGPRSYTQSTLKKLYGLSGNICAFPGCTKKLVNRTTSNESNICHIEAAYEGGERYNSDMTDDERADYANLILLCPEHHQVTNDEEIYTVEKLRNMKAEHEEEFLNSKLKNSSMLFNVINEISKLELEDEVENESLNPYDPKDKLSYNDVKKYYSIIQEYKVYHSKINSLYDELELQGSIKKQRLLSNIYQIYLKKKAEVVLDSQEPMSIIRQRSDDIIDMVYEELCIRLDDSGLFEEDIYVGVQLIIVDSFIRCKILEEPIENAVK